MDTLSSLIFHIGDRQGYLMNLIFIDKISLILMKTKLLVLDFKRHISSQITIHDHQMTEGRCMATVTYFQLVRFE